ncbi:hypothetical protein JCM31271_31650 [Halorubrum trueperi]
MFGDVVRDGVLDVVADDLVHRDVDVHPGGQRGGLLLEGDLGLGLFVGGVGERDLLGDLVEPDDREGRVLPTGDGVRDGE